MNASNPHAAHEGGWNPAWVVRTGRLVMRPVSGTDAADLMALKADPRAYAMMLGGVRAPWQAAAELADEVRAWGALGIGLWAARDRKTEAFYGVAGIVPRADGRGMALRFAFWPEARGHGLAREAAIAALHFGHERRGLTRIIAVARGNNAASLMLLTSIGMSEEPASAFERDGFRMQVFVSHRPPGLPPPVFPAPPS
ncbi:GNAT family N-acetyltransferase [Acidisoma sp. C75]